MKKVFILLCFVLLFSLVISTFACGGDNAKAPSLEILKLRIGPEDAKMFPYGNKTHYLYYDNPDRIPDDWLTCFWQYLDNNGVEIAYDTPSFLGETARELLTSPTYYMSETGKVFLDQINKEGIYTVKATLYIKQEWDRLRFDAAPLGSATTKLDVRNLQIKIESNAYATGNNCLFRANCLNPEYLGNQSALSYNWDFGDSQTQKISQNNEVSHEFTKDGEYNVSVSLSWPLERSRGTVTIATAQMKITSNKSQQIPLQISLKLDPELAYGDTITPVGLNAKLNIDASVMQDNAVYEWDFGDKSSVETLGISYSFRNHQYKSPGVYQVTVNLRDKNQNILATATAKVIINNLNLLKKTTYTTGTISAYFTIEWGNKGGGVYSPNKTENDYGKVIGWNSYDPPLTWESNTFKWTGESINTKLKQETMYTLAGKISDDGSTILEFTYTRNFTAKDYNGPGKDWQQKEVLRLKNIPLTPVAGGDKPKLTFVLTGETVAQHVESYQYEDTDGRDAYVRFLNFDWTYKITLPKIEVTFLR